MRLYLAGMHTHYSVLGGEGETPNTGKKGLSESEWNVLKKFLTAHEVKILRSFGGFKPFVPLTWALADVKTALEGMQGKGRAKIVIDLRGNTGGYFPGASRTGSRVAARSASGSSGPSASTARGRTPT